jgi:NADH dehydrogenase FAD-containing subunit
VTKEPQLPPFRYFHKVNLAVGGKKFAVLQSGRFMMSGLLAWLI